MATYKGKDVQGILEQFRATLEERDLIHPGDSIGTDDATLQCAACDSRVSSIALSSC